MSQKAPENADAPRGEAAEAVVKRRRGFSPIWLIPIVATVVAASLAYQAIQERGPQVVIVFESAEGLEAGKSKVKYREVEIGTVDLVRIVDLKHVEVHCSLDKATRPHLTEDTKWWVVRPRIGAGGISGLETILSGAYLTAQFGKDGGKTQRKFVGLEEPPLADGGALGLVLEAGSLGGVAVGNAVYYREVPVGFVVSSALAKDGSKVRIRVKIAARHASLVHSNSVFWNAGGITADLGLHGLHIHAESLKALLLGGIAFAAPRTPGHPVSEGSVFQLHPEAKDKWLKWQSEYRPKGDDAEKHGALARFFHHEGKSEAEAKEEASDPEEHKHGFMGGLFHRGD